VCVCVVALTKFTDNRAYEQLLQDGNASADKDRNKNRGRHGQKKN
jgi:hypothetical protein